MGIVRFIVGGVLLVLALGALISIFFAVVGIAILLAKIALVVLVASWLFRKLFGRRRRTERVLVGPPVAEVVAPRRDKYEVEAERELDRELGL